MKTAGRASDRNQLQLGEQGPAGRSADAQAEKLRAAPATAGAEAPDGHGGDGGIFAADAQPLGTKLRKMAGAMAAGNAAVRITTPGPGERFLHRALRGLWDGTVSTCTVLMYSGVMTKAGNAAEKWKAEDALPAFSPRRRPAATLFSKPGAGRAV